MRDKPVPCVNATHYEVIRGEHLTWNDSDVCPQCERVLDLFAARRLLAEPFDGEALDPAPETE